LLAVFFLPCRGCSRSTLLDCQLNKRTSDKHAARRLRASSNHRLLARGPSECNHLPNHDGRNMTVLHRGQSTLWKRKMQRRIGMGKQALSTMSLEWQAQRPSSCVQEFCILTERNTVMQVKRAAWWLAISVLCIVLPLSCAGPRLRSAKARKPPMQPASHGEMLMLHCS
jgi:hypothetical protein